jgi:hypothetical protein
MKSTQGIPIYLKLLKAIRRWRSKEIFNGLHQPEDQKEQIIRPLVVLCHLERFL